MRNTKIRKTKLHMFLEHKLFDRFIISAIIINTIALALETNTTLSHNFEKEFFIVNLLFSGIFFTEITVKLSVYRKKFFKDGWNNFDLIVVIATTIPGAQSITALRSLRVLRLLRLTSQFGSLRKVVEQILRAIPGVFSTIILFLLVYVIGAIMSTLMFQDISPEYFGSLSKSTFSLFQIMTLEAWSSNIARPLIELSPFASPFFVLFIIATNFILINFFVAVFIDATNSISTNEQNHKIYSLEKKLDILISMQEQNNKTE